MTHPIQVRTVSLALALAAATTAQGTLQISLGIRETEAGGGTFSTIGGDGGELGGIEFVNRDAQTLTLDGTWQQFTFNITTDPLIGFAGASANGVLDGTFGTLEHVRVLNSTGITDPITLWIDDVTDTTLTGGAVNFGDFEGFASGTEVMFQEPGFSGSTAANLMMGSTSGVDNLVASRTSSCRFDFQFIDNLGTRWVRLTTFRAINQRNPQIRLDDQSVVTFWMRGGVCQESLGSQGPGTAIAEMCGPGLRMGQTSVYYTAGAPAGAPGALAISLFGQPDLPIFGGNLVSALGVLIPVTIGADGNGRFSLPVSGTGAVADLVLQSLFFDTTQAQNFTFTNALHARFGR